MVSSWGHSCLNSSLCGLPGNAHRKPVCVLYWGNWGRRGGASLHALKCVFYSCCTISFHILNLLAHFYAPCWPHHHHIKHDLKKEKTGGGSILVLPILLSLLLPSRLPSFSSSLPHFSYPTKSNKWKTNQGSVAQKKFHGTLSPTHAQKAALAITTTIQQIQKSLHNEHKKVWTAKLCYSVSSWQNSFNINRFDIWLEIDTFSFFFFLFFPSFFFLFFFLFLFFLFFSFFFFVLEMNYIQSSPEHR